MERLYNAVKDDNFGFLIDVGNFLCVDEDPRIASVEHAGPEEPLIGIKKARHISKRHFKKYK